MGKARRMAQLDVLRFLAVLLVLGHHWEQLITKQPWFVVKHYWYAMGWTGVPLFFVLSGFLVSGILFRELNTYGRVDIKRFLVRRALKIYPAFYVFIFISLIASQFGLRPYYGLGLRRTVVELFFVQNFIGGLWGHTWSLAIEEHFYLLVALGFWLIASRAQHEDYRISIPKVMLLIMGGSLVLRIALQYLGLLRFTDTYVRMDALAFGVLLAYYYHCKQEWLSGFTKRYRIWITIASWGLVVYVFSYGWHSKSIYTTGCTFLYLGFGGLLLLMLYSQLFARVADTRPLRFLSFLGEHSYSTYLWHAPMAFWFGSYFAALLAWGMPDYAAVWVYVAASFGSGILLARLVEIPVLRLRDRLLPSRSTAV